MPTQTIRTETVTPPEEWRPVVGWEGWYEISSLGRVKSLPRRVGVWNKGATRINPERILVQSKRRPKPGLVSYRYVGLVAPGRKKITRNVHNLVAEAFLGPRPAGMNILHGPGGTDNNSVSNLSYGSQAQNMADKKRDGTWALGSNVAQSKLTEKIVAECRRRYGGYESTLKELAEQFGVNHATLSHAVYGRTWGHVVDPPPLPHRGRFGRVVLPQTRAKLGYRKVA